MRSLVHTELLQALRNTEEIIVFDTETSGLKPDEDRIIQLSAVKMKCAPPVDGHFEEVGRLNLYIKPPFKITGFIEELTGITNEILEKSEDEETCFKKIFEFFGETPAVAAYNSTFDIVFMRALYERNDHTFAPEFNIDVLAAAREILAPDKVSDHRQETVAAHYKIVPEGELHNSMVDTMVCKQLLERFYEIYRSGIVAEKEHCNVFRCYYYERKEWNQRLVYVITNLGKIYFNAKKYSWGESSDNRGVLKRIDIGRLEKELFERYNANSYSEFIKNVRRESNEKASA